MNAAQFDRGDGIYAYDGEEFPDLGDLIHGGFLKFCGCGRQEVSLDFLLGALELINERGPENYGTEGQQAWKLWWESHQQRVLAHFGSDGAAYFFYYWADKEGLTEHGGSVPGWLADKGEDLLDLLREWKAG